MSSNIELALLTKVIEEQAPGFSLLEKMHITDEFFTTPEAQQLYQFLRDHYHHPETNGIIPDFEMVRYRFPTFYPLSTQDKVATLAHQLKREKIKLDLLTLAQNISTAAEADPFAAVASLRTGASQISSLAETGDELSMASAYNMLLSEYEMVAESGGLIGIPFPWTPLNEETQGMQESQFIVLYGRPKSMKSWIAIWIAVFCYIHCRRRVLFYSREMSKKLVARRVAAAICRVDYNAFKNGRLQPNVKYNVFEVLKDLMEDENSVGNFGYRQPYFKIITDSGGSSSRGGGVSWLQAKIRENDPDIVFIDGMYLMKDDRKNIRSVDWKNIANISQDLKLTANDFNIPVFGVTQANRASEKSLGDDLTELAYADALGQDADAVLRASRKVRIDEQTKQKITEVYITAPGLREGVFEGIVLNAHPAVRFEYARTLVSKEEAEDSDYGKPKAKYRRSNLDPRIAPPPPPQQPR